MITQLAFLELAAKACPRRVEATFSALLMSVFNAGNQSSQVVGGYLYDWLGYTALVLISSAFTAVRWPHTRPKTPSAGPYSAGRSPARRSARPRTASKKSRPRYCCWLGKPLLRMSSFFPIHPRTFAKAHRRPTPQ